MKDFVPDSVFLSQPMCEATHRRDVRSSRISSIKSRLLRPSIVLGLTTFLLTAAIRFLSLNGFPNDHFVHLALARQILLGDLPVRDFQDPGRPLMYGPSVVAQLLLGQTFFWETILSPPALGLAGTITAAVVMRLTSSIPLALGAVAFEVLIFPRTYSY